MQLDSPGVVIIGAGIFGVTAALELRRRGWSVALLEAGPIPHPDASSTDASKLVRMDYGGDEHLTELAARSLEGWEAWNRSWGEPLYHPDGVLFLRAEPPEPGTFEGDSRRLLSARGVALEDLAAHDLGQRFPAWNTEAFPHGYFNPRGGWVESARVVERLAQEASDAGVLVRERVTAVGLAGDDRVEGVEADDGSLWQADAVVVAVGCWTPLFLPDLARVLTPVAQPLVYLRPHDPEPFRTERFPPWTADVSRTGWYGFPVASDGTVKVAHHGKGWRLLPGGGSVPPEHLERCRDFLRDAVPQLADAPVERTRICFYCDSVDGYFWILRVPEREGLVVASGGSGHGFKFGPVLGALVADAVEERPEAAVSPFAWRTPEEPSSEQARHRED